MSRKKFLSLILVCWLIFIYGFLSQREKFEHHACNNDKMVNVNKHVELFGHIYNFRGLDQIFFPSAKNVPPIPKNISEIFSKINFILFNNKVFLIDKKILITKKLVINQTSLITYGLEITRLSALIQALKLTDLLCNINVSYGESLAKTIPASVYIKCANLTVQITIFYSRGNFFWIPKDNCQFKDKNKIFNDQQRALNKFQTKPIQISSDNFFIPEDVEKFIYDYNRSKFIECNVDMAHSAGLNYHQNKVKNVFAFYKFFQVKNILESYKKDYWLSAGTLLGWYRDCGIIPHTTDGDIGVLAQQYDPDLEQAFLTNDQVPMIKRLGFINDSLEFRVGSEDFPIDIFFTYNFNQTHMMYSIQAIRKVYRIFLTRMRNLCSAQLFEEKFFVPCDPNLMLDEIYGRNLWIKPEKGNKMSPSVFLWKKWSPEEWKNAVQFFENGTLLKNYTSNFIKSYI